MMRVIITGAALIPVSEAMIIGRAQMHIPNSTVNEASGPLTIPS